MRGRVLLRRPAKFRLLATDDKPRILFSHGLFLTVPPKTPRKRDDGRQERGLSPFSSRCQLHTFPPLKVLHQNSGLCPSLQDMASTDRDVLLVFYRSTDGPNWKNNANWGTDAALSDWYGVKANGEGRVLELSLGYNNLRGIFRLISLSCDVLDLSQEIGDRQRSFHEIASFTGGYNVVFDVCPRVAHAIYA